MLDLRQFGGLPGYHPRISPRAPLAFRQHGDFTNVLSQVEGIREFNKKVTNRYEPDDQSTALTHVVDRWSPRGSSSGSKKGQCPRDGADIVR